MIASSPPPLSRFRRVGNLVFTSGQLPRGADGAIVEGDIGVQTQRAIDNLQSVLREAGAELTDVVKVTAWITQVDHMAGFNAVYREMFDAPYPARSTVISGLVAGDVEIEAIALIE